MLERIHIQNFKSLKDVMLDLKKINLLIGPNNSGKSNFLKALEFYSRHMNKNAQPYTKINEFSYQHRNTYNEGNKPHTPVKFSTISENKRIKQTIELYGDAKLSKNSDFGYSYLVGRLKTNTDDKLQLLDLGEIEKFYENFIYGSFNYHQYLYGKGSKELLEHHNIQQQHFNPFHLLNDGDSYKFNHYFNDDFFSKKSNYNNISYNTIIDDEQLFNFVNLIREYFYNTLIYKPDPNKMLLPYPTTGDNFVSADASNIVSFLDTMKSENQEVIEKIQFDLKECVGEFKEIILETINRSTLEKELNEKYGDYPYENHTVKRIGVKDITGNIFKASEISEGITYFIAILAIIHQPNPPKLLLLEEPEKGIHPRRIAEIIRYIQRLAQDKDIQVIMTSHSPLVLDEFAHDPESIFVFDKENGETIVRNLQRDIIDPKNEILKQKGIEPIDYEENLSENWLMGLLNGVPND